ncbi:uncharacterized protein LOC133928263 isoform X2 [Phragmites australis]|uniref:uncharacterized protein LOC133928263 isoform X2 n=1 Tax=Phragmites australis TaxID=29695 RepID=UPI002D79F695|nr:uncharacterized protein LOC133928263 isoform X2 [Phragmites australis]
MELFLGQAGQPHIRFAVREKRADAKSALKNLLLSGSPYQESSNKQMRKQKVSGKSNGQRSCPGKNRHSKNKCGHNWRNFDEDDCTDTSYGTFGGKRSFTWYWPEDGDGLGSSPSGFQWRDESQTTKSRKKFWNESDVDEEEELVHDNLQSHRISLGLPCLGPLKLDHIKSAFRASALKWHPDKHQGPSQVSILNTFICSRLKQRKSSSAVWKHTMHWLVPSSQVAKTTFGACENKENFLELLMMYGAAGVSGHRETISRKMK